MACRFGWGSAFVAVLIPLLWSTQAHAADADLQEKHGTVGVEAAKHIERAVALSAKPIEALKEIDAAVQAEPGCSMAHYRRGMILVSLGEVHEGLKAFGRAIEAAPQPGNAGAVEAALGAGEILLRLERPEEAAEWFSRAVLTDPTDIAGLRGKAWCGIASCRRSQKQYLAASLCDFAACVDGAQGMSPAQVREDAETSKGLSTARLLSSPWSVPALRERKASPMLPVPIAGDADAVETVRRLLPEPQSGTVVAVCPNERWYYLFSSGARPSLRRIDLPGKAKCAAVAAGRIYVMCGEPYAFHIIDPTTGKVERSFDPGWLLPTSLAPYPSQGTVYFAVACGRIYRLDLVTGAVVDTDIPGDFVASDPKEKYLFVYMHPGSHCAWYGSVLFGGEAASLEVTDQIVKYINVGGEMLPSEVRLGAAWACDGLTVSPDGRWVTPTGTLGWKAPWTPSWRREIGIMNAENIEKGYAISSDGACPWVIAVNPVTGQTAAVVGKAVHVMQPTKDSGRYTIPWQGTMEKGALAMSGLFAPALAWSPDGDYLVAAREGGGLCAYANALTDEEKAAARAWRKDLVPEAKAIPHEGIQTLPPAAVLPALAEYAVVNSRPEVSAALAAALASGRTSPPPSWRKCSFYARSDDLILALQDLETALKWNDDSHWWIRMNNVPRGNPPADWLRYFSAVELQRNGGGDGLMPRYIGCIRADQGRTDLSVACLDAVADLLGNGNPMQKMHALALSLQLDRNNPRTLTAIYPLLKAHKFDAEAAALSALYPKVFEIKPVLPKLAVPDAGAEALSAVRVYEKAAASVVLIQSRRGSGTGFCVAPGIIVTNDHITGGDAEVGVYPFRIEDGRPARMTRLAGTVIARRGSRDIAVVRVANPPAGLAPLDVAAANPKPGEKVFAIGNPGLGLQALEQTITEGLISSGVRVIRGSAFLQHTAALNRGNSGGPLLNEKGQVVGVNALKARLEGIGFAIPVEDLRRLFLEP